MRTVSKSASYTRNRADRSNIAGHRAEAARSVTPGDESEKKYDAQFRVVFDAIRELMVPPAPVRRRIGFRQG
ncbi:MAG: hypothetical protein Q8Q85_12670 [Gemmatimonadales bacterium]|nr:hypothetical protein [Gemmatimonadales bacterium]